MAWSANRSWICQDACMRQSGSNTAMVPARSVHDLCGKGNRERNQRFDRPATARQQHLDQGSRPDEQACLDAPPVRRIVACAWSYLRSCGWKQRGTWHPGCEPRPRPGEKPMGSFFGCWGGSRNGEYLPMMRWLHTPSAWLWVSMCRSTMSSSGRKRRYAEHEGAWRSASCAGRRRGQAPQVCRASAQLPGIRAEPVPAVQRGRPEGLVGARRPACGRGTLRMGAPREFARGARRRSAWRGRARHGC